MAEEIKNEEVMSESELDNVAGGSNWQNKDLITTMLKVNRQDTMKFLEIWDQKAPDANVFLREGMRKLLTEYIAGTGLHATFELTATSRDNRYFIDGKEVGHEAFKKYLDNTF